MYHFRIENKDMPKDIGGWQAGQKAYHIRFMNKRRLVLFI